MVSKKLVSLVGKILISNAKDMDSKILQQWLLRI